MSLPCLHQAKACTRPAPATAASAIAFKHIRLVTRALRRSPVCKAANQQEDRIATQTIDDMERNYCDDFECTSSPAVEVTVRSFAREISRVKPPSASLYQRDCTYTDSFRSFTGSDKVATQRWYTENIQKPVVTISKMRMLDKATAQIDWRINGLMGGNPADIGVTSTITMNLLTGRIQSHKETWDLSKLSPQAGAMASVGRMIWSLKLASSDASSGISKKVQDSLSSTDGDESDSGYAPNPSDPTRFFMQNGGDGQWNDYVSYAFIAALLYLAFKAFAALEQL